MKKNFLLYGIVAAIFAAVVTGGFFPEAGKFAGIAGEIFLNLLMMIVVPLVILSMITGITNLGDISRVGRLGVRTIAYYMATTAIAVMIGMILVSFIQPGAGMNTKKQITGVISSTTSDGRILKMSEKNTADTLKEVVLGNTKEKREGLIPSNIFNAMVNMEILPLIFFSVLFGLALASLGEKAAAAVELFSILNESMMKIVSWVMMLAPLGIFGIVAERIGRAGGFIGFLPELQAVGWYAFTVVTGLIIHGLLILPLLYRIYTGKNPIVFLRGLAAPLLNAFSTASSSATLPMTMDAVQHKCGVSQRISGFVLPVGATINMDGTALYEAVAAVFIAQVYGIQLGLAEQGIIFFTSTLAAVGAAGIPEAGLITMVIVLRAAGLPVEGVGLILTIDWFLDRCRTTVNVWGDSIGAGIIDAREIKNNLKN